MRGRGIAITLAAAAAGTALAANAVAAVHVYPGCGSTLRACATAAQNGDTISLKTNGVARIPSFKITKGLSFRPAPGYKPTIGSTASFSQFELYPTQSHVTVFFRGIRFKDVEISVQFQSKSGHRVVFENNRFSVPANEVAISSYYSSTSRGSFTARDNRIRTGGEGIDTRVQGGPTVIEGNTIDGTGPTPIYGGVLFYEAEANGMAARVANNVIRHADTALGIGVFSPARVNLRLLNNTVDDVGTGGGFYLSSDDGAALNVSFFNNVVSNAAGAGIAVYPSGDTTVTGGRNDEYNNGADELNSHDVGPLLNIPPDYLDRSAGDLRLRSSSGLVNAGQTCIAATPLPRADAAGQFRIAGPAVEIGAYERGSTINGSVPGRNKSGTDTVNTIQGTSGRDVLCGLGSDDTIRGKGGGDFIYGGDGADHLFGGDGSDVARGEAGADHIDLRDHVSRNDTAYGGPDTDVCLADPGDRRHGCP